jgi:hypothetical protein
VVLHLYTIPDKIDFVNAPACLHYSPMSAFTFFMTKVVQSGSEVLTVVIMKSSDLWDMTPCLSVESQPTFGKNIVCRFPFQGRRISQARHLLREICSKLCHAGFLLGLLFDPEDGSDIFLRNVVGWFSDYMVPYPRTYNSSLFFRFTRAHTHTHHKRLLMAVNQSGNEVAT